MPFEQYLPSQVFILVLIFARLGAMVMLMPGLGETYVNVRVRLFAALALTLALAPAIEASMPTAAPPLSTLILLVFGEFIIGIYFGLLARMLLLTLDTTGRIVAFSTGLAAAQVFNPSSTGQGTLPGLFLSMLGILIFFVTDMHHMMIAAMVDSYQLFKPGQSLPINDLSDALTVIFARSFTVAVQLAAPFMIFSLLFFVSLGIIARLMPQMQIFFVGLPIQLAVGILLMAAALMALMQVFTEYFASNLQTFMLPR